MEQERSLFSNYNIATFALVFMSVQFLYIEGWAISIPKVAFMAITPLIMMFRTQYLSKATGYAALYIVITLCFLFLKESFRSATIYYSILFFLTFNLYYNLVYHEKVYNIDDFIGIIKKVIYAYAICLIIQQLCFVIGLRYFPPANLMGLEYYELFRLNSLAIEPSHAARLLTVYFYALLKLSEYKNDGYPLSMNELWKEHKWTIIAFLYTMICIGSGTAFVALAILSLYFLKREYVLFVLTASFAFYMAVPYIDYEPLTRAINVFNATLTGDTEVITDVDSSAAARVNIIVDTFTQLDLSDPAIWFGGGTDSDIAEGKHIVSAITDYGMFSYISKLIFFYACCFTSFLSLETIMFILLFGMNIGNIAYGFATLMVLATVKYFKENYENE